MTVLFCLADDAYAMIIPKVSACEALKRLPDSEVLAPVLLQQLREIESSRSFLRNAERFFAHLFPTCRRSCRTGPALTRNGCRTLRRTLVSRSVSSPAGYVTPAKLLLRRW
ncbi:MAG: hypothetical protein AVDCRST_MAG93-1541 [uncultured Chloroflexia bacterium]|uniref:Uncharacterized protein n=1 Tax=uncultured Chloroflexia bacterium TaxID=1672391 RepID=A0A6J4I9G4_9CHLR|nr:MAG: hypothetical protein AVDCRST_MAG93-1541 [uncultured Chloroflexia bacterium]